MKIKFLLILSLFLAAMSCSKEDEPLPADWDPEYTVSSWGYTDYSEQKTNTPKGSVYYKLVYKTDLPEWLLSKTESIAYGYIMKAGSGDDILYFVYDKEKEYGVHYDALGNQTTDNPKLKDWVIIYKWNPNLGLSTPKGWCTYRPFNKADLPEWLLSKTESIANGYIMRALYGGDKIMYFVYDEDKEYGQHYDEQGNPAKDNDKIKHWVIIYRWDPTSGMLTPNGWGCYKLVNKEDLPAWLLSKTESIANGYIMKAGSGDNILYFVCCKDNTDGKYYDAQGNPTTYNYKLRNWAIIYTWGPE